MTNAKCVVFSLALLTCSFCIGACGSLAQSSTDASTSADGNTVVDSVATATDANVLYADPNSAVVGVIIDGNIVLSPTVEVGPYWVDEGLERSDVTTDPNTGVVQDGMPLVLQITVHEVSGTTAAPLSGAKVDIWQANAQGLYSDEAAEHTTGVRYLRGYQTTDADGVVTFKTIVPGWYSGRAPHIHARLRINSSFNWTTQVFFDDTFIADVYKNSPYSARTNQDTFASNDRLYQAACVEGTKHYLCGELSEASITANAAGGYIARATIYVNALTD